MNVDHFYGGGLDKLAEVLSLDDQVLVNLPNFGVGKNF